MEFQKKRLALIMASLLATTMVSGCDWWSDDDSDETPTPLVCEAPSFVNDAGTACATLPELSVPVENPNIQLTPPSEPTPPAEDELQIAFVDQQAATRVGTQAARALDAGSPYAAWNLHLWNNENCDALDPSELNADWNDVSVVPDSADSFGPVWNLKLAKTEGCINVIIRDGDKNKVVHNDDLRVVVSGDRAVAFTQGIKTPFDSRLAAWESNPPGLGIGEARAHWIDVGTLVISGVPADNSVRLYFSADGSFNVGPTGLLGGTFQGVALAATTLSDDQKAKYPHLAEFAAFTVPANINIKERLKGEVVAATIHEDGYVTGATRVQMPGVIDALYTSGTADADEAQLGAIVSGDGVTFNLWAPTAKSVKLHLFDAAKTAMGDAVAMTLNPATGIWTHAGTTELVGSFYKYEVEVYHPATGEVESLMVTDPYSVSLSTNSVYSQVVDLNDPALKPAGWDDYETPAPESIVIYESHIRDFSALDESVSAANRGKYLAFTETDSAPVKHLKALKDAGLTYFHLLPAFDIATVNEDPAMRVDITDTVAKLCEVNDKAAACKAESGIARDAVIKDLLAEMDPASSEAQAFLADVRNYDGFNWGYDPFHYGAPEGSYASNPDGTARILEFRQMVKALHDMGLGVAMDVVYNHTNASGLSEKSVLDKVVPGYYHRLSATTGAVETSTCCDNTATEHRMMAKLMIDTLATWTEAYKIDSFRFDLMGHQPLEAMEEALEVTRAINPNMYFYGEGWNFGEVENDARFTQATQLNLGGTGIGSFSDRLRDAVRGGSPFNSGADIRRAQGFATGLYNDPNELNSGSDSEKERLMAISDQIMVELAGNLADFLLVSHEGEVVRGKDVDYNGQPSGYTQSPLEVISYVEKHDNQTFWDIAQYKLPSDMDSLERTRAQIFALSFPLLGQGVPFIHMGSDLLRSKSMERDSYDSGDWYNIVDFTGQTNNWNVGLPREDKDGANWELIGSIISNSNTKPVAADIELASTAFQELLSIRNSSKLFNLSSKEAVMARVDFHNVGPEQTPGVIVMSIDDGSSAGADLDSEVDGIVIVFNGSDESYVKDLGLAGLVPHDMQVVSAEASVEGSTITVPGYTTAVFVLPQDGEQGAGIPVAAKVYQNCDPFDGTKMYVRGGFNGWGTANEAKYNGCGLFTGVVTVEAAGVQEFKIGSSDWAKEIAFADVTAGEGGLALTAGDGGNIAVDLPAAGTYAFALNASIEGAYTLTVTSYTDVPPLGENVAFVVGGFNGWGDGFTADYQLEYVGAGVYSVTYSPELEANLATEFKVASNDWKAVDLGAVSGQSSIQAGQTKPVQEKGGNFSTTFEPGYDYTFTVDLFYAEQPTLTLTRTAQAGVQTCVALPDSTDAAPLGDVRIGMTGDAIDSGWNFVESLEFKYKGANKYQMVLTDKAIKGTYGFKVRGSEAWSTQFVARSSGSAVSNIQLDQVYDLYGFSGGSGDVGNNNTNLDTSSGTYIFTLTFGDDLSGIATAGVQGTYTVCQVTE